jgi:hypothetical protein
MSTPSFPQDADEAIKRVKELSDKMIELTKKKGVAWLKIYEMMLGWMIRLQERLAASTQIKWIIALTAANAASCVRCQRCTPARCVSNSAMATLRFYKA